MAKKRKKKAAKKSGGKKAARKPTKAPDKTGAAKGGGTGPEPAKKVDPKQLASLRKAAAEAKAKLDAAKKEAEALNEKARGLVARAKADYQKAVTPYREACRKAGRKCEFEGGRSANVADRVSFVLEKTKTGVKVTIKGRPKTEEVIPFQVLKKAAGKAAYAYTDKHLGTRDKIGNKGGGLANRLRAAMA